MRKYLADAPMGMSALYGAARGAILTALSNIQGEKALVVDRSFMGVLGYITDFSSLKVLSIYSENNKVW